MGKTIAIELDVGQLQGAAVAVTGLDKAVQRLGQSLRFVLMGQSLGDYMQTALEKTGKVSDELLVMRLALGKLRVAVGNAFAPIAQILLPAVNEMIFAAIRFVRMVGRITHALFGIKESSADAALSEENFAAAVTSSSKAAQKSLASFDRLNRLQAQTAGSVSVSGGSSANKKPYNYEIDDLEEYLFVGTLKNMWQTLKQIDLKPIREAFRDLKSSLVPILQKLGESFLWFYQFVLVPVAKWAAETALPKVLETLGLALDVLSVTIEACKPALLYLWENFLLPLGKWVADRLMANLENLQNKLTDIGNWMVANEVPASQLLLYASMFLGKILPLNDALEIFRVLGIDTNDMLTYMQLLLAGMGPEFQIAGNYLESFKGQVNGLGGSWGKLITEMAKLDQLSAMWRNVSDLFRVAVWDPVKEGFRKMGNGVLATMGTLGGHLATAFNGLFDSMNEVSISVPDWVPFIGGKQFGFSLGKLRMPQIPALAQGAVLPANKPFLAMVGDQRHGTNIEAPLATIQDAVRLELQDMLEGNLAGQEATVSVLRQILDAVLGISVGDEVLGAAAERYQRKMAVVHGF